METDELTPGGYFSEFAWHSFEDGDDTTLEFQPFENVGLLSTLPDTAQPEPLPGDTDAD